MKFLKKKKKQSIAEFLINNVDLFMFYENKKLNKINHFFRNPLTFTVLPYRKLRIKL